MTADLPELPAPEPFRPAPMKCAACGEEAKLRQPGPTAWGAAYLSGACTKCGGATFIATIAVCTPPSLYTAEQMREYATSALQAAHERIRELERGAVLADQYERWIRFHAAGNGDFEDFLRRDTSIAGSTARD